MSIIASENIVYDHASIARRQLLHEISKAARKLVPAGWLDELEFEYRYRRYIAEYGESDSDIYISTFSKSGTTWTQLILYQLTTDGDMDFDHLFDVSPWLWYAAQRRVEPAHPPQPRLLKSHDDYRRFKNGRRGRFLFVVRDGPDVCLSLFHHRRNFKRYTGSFEEHFEDFLHGTEYNWFDHLRAWLLNGYGLNLQVIKFEDLKNDFAATVRSIADFCEIELDEERLLKTSERCSFTAMKEHEARLGPRNSHFEGVKDAPYEVKHADQFIRKGDVGEGRASLTTSQLRAYRDRFDRALGDIEIIANYR
ncbi:MAG: sulfotransferase domain-containing protein [Pseudomonadales bacterium]